MYIQIIVDGATGAGTHDVTFSTTQQKAYIRAPQPDIALQYTLITHIITHGQVHTSISNIFTPEFSTCCLDTTYKHTSGTPVRRVTRTQSKASQMIMSYMHRDSTVQSSNDKGI